MRKKVILIAILVSGFIIVGLFYAYCNYTPDKTDLDKGTEEAIKAYGVEDSIEKVDTKWDDKTYYVTLHVNGLYETLEPAIKAQDEEYLYESYYKLADTMVYIPDSAKAIIGFKGFYKNSNVTLYDDKAEKKLFVVTNGEISYDCVTELRLEVAEENVQ